MQRFLKLFHGNVRQRFAFRRFCACARRQLRLRFEGKELLIPFAVLEQDGKQSIERFYAETQEEAIVDGKASLDRLRNRLDYWAFGREDLRSVNGGNQKTDVLVISTWAQGLEQPVILMQNYSSPMLAVAYIFLAR